MSHYFRIVQYNVAAVSGIISAIIAVQILFPLHVKLTRVHSILELQNVTCRTYWITECYLPPDTSEHTPP